jgi:glutathione S-transferase
MKFYDCATAPSPRRVRIFLAEKGIAVPTIQVDLRNGEQFTPAFRAINPDCTVPVLVLDDGTTIPDAIAICRYIEELHPDPLLMGRNTVERALVESWQRPLTDADCLTDQNSLICFRQPFEVKAAFVIAVLRETAKAKAATHRAPSASLLGVACQSTCFLHIAPRRFGARSMVDPDRVQSLESQLFVDQRRATTSKRRARYQGRSSSSPIARACSSDRFSSCGVKGRPRLFARTFKSFCSSRLRVRKVDPSIPPSTT